MIRISIAAALGLSAATLVSCGSSGGGLIPLASAGPLRGDFETVVRAAAAGNGDCRATTQALETTERDFRTLPSIDAGLHSRLSEGIKNLRSQALALCEQPLANTSTTTAATTTKSIQTTPTNTATQSTSTTTTNTQSTPTSTTSTQTNTQLPPGGGTQAPSEGASEGAPAGGEKGEAGPNPGSSGGTSQGATK